MGIGDEMSKAANGPAPKDKTLPGGCSGPTGAAPAKFTTFHAADRDTGAPCVFEEINPAYVEYLEKQLAAKQAEIDRLMIEHCPDEMGIEQLSAWAAHQRPAPVDDQYENGGHDPYIDPAYG